MSDRELRQVLTEVIEDIESGRVVPWRGRRLRRILAGSALAAGLALGGCGGPVYGVPAVDAGPEAGPVDAYGIPIVDARPEAGAVDAYGIPVMDADVDAMPTEDASVADDAALDDGGVFLYGAPPPPEDAP